MTSTFYKKLLVNLLLGTLFTCGAVSIQAQTSAFTYQGNLTDSSMAANGVYDFQFQLYNSLGNPSGTAINVDDVTVTNGIFTVQLDFGAGAFQQVALTSRSMEIRVRPGTSTGAYTALAPRQPFTAAPIAIAATKAETATNANFLGNVAANQYVQTNDARLSDSRTPTAGSSSYIQNNATATAQPSTNFNISGNGKIGNTLTTFDALISNDLTVQNDVTIQGVFTGGGAGITGLNASNISTGTINAARIPSLDASKITTGSFGTAQIPSLDAAKITTGTFADARLSSNVALRNSSQTFTGNQTVSGTLTATVVSADTQYNIAGFPVLRNTGTNNLFVGNSTYTASSTGSENTFLGKSAGGGNTTGASNTFVGYNAGNTNTTGSNNTLLGAGAIFNSSSSSVYATAIGAGSETYGSNSISLGRSFIPNGLGRDPGPDQTLVNGALQVVGLLSVDARIRTRLGTGGTNSLCYNIINFGFTSTYELATCSSSIRYKKDVENFSSGLDLVKRLRPVTFTWKSDNSRDLGFVAEEVNAVEPLMTTYNEKGEVEGVKYDRISAALVNAVNEQQTEIATQKTQTETQNTQIETQNTQIQNQQKTIERQQKQINVLMKFVCAANRNADVCKAEDK